MKINFTKNTLNTKLFGFFSSIIIALIYFTLSSSSNGIGNQAVNGCSCHGASASPNTLVTLTGLPVGGYVNGTTYTLTVTVTNTTIIGSPISKAGFNLKSSIGTFTFPTAVGTKTIVSNTELTHTTPQNLTLGTTSWSAIWQAPPSGTAMVTFNLAGNAVNGNGNQNGDFWNKITATLNAAPIPLSVTASAAAILCNGGSTTINAVGLGGLTPYQYQLNSSLFQASPSFNLTMSSNYTLTIKDANNATASTVINISQPNALTASITNSAILCNGGLSIIQINSSGGTGTLNYRLNGGIAQSSNAFLNNVAGTYTTTTTDANLCTKTSVVTITQPSAITTSASATSINCNGGLSTIIVSSSGATGILNYKLNNGIAQSSNAFLNNVAGTYTTTTTDANLCTKTSVVTITQPSAITTSATATSINCNGGLSTITVSSSGGTGLLNYKLNNGVAQASNIFSNNTAGAYTLTTIDANNCSVNTTLTISQPSAINVNASVSNALCFIGSLGTITPNAIGGISPYSYTINGNPISSGYVAGNYTVVATASNLCTATTNVTVTTSVGVASAIYSNPSGTCNLGANTISLVSCDSIKGNGWVDFIDSNNGNIILSINPNGNNIGIVSASLFNTDNFSIATNTDLSGFNWNYLNKIWNISATNDFNLTTPISIRLYFTDTELSNLFSGSNCGNCGDFDMVVSQSSFPSNLEDCNAANNLNSILNLYWNKNSSNTAIEQSHIAQGATSSPSISNYYGNITSGIGKCISGQDAFNGKYIELNTSSFSEFRIHAPSSIPLPGSLVLNGRIINNLAHLNWANENNKSSKNYLVQKSINGINFNTIAQIKNDVLQTSYVFIDENEIAEKVFYRVVVEDNNGSFEQSNIITFNTINETSFSIYPNPIVSGLNLLFKANQNEMAAIKIMDVTGKIVFTKNILCSKGLNDYYVNIPNLSSGTYTIQCQTHSNKFVRTITKQ